jgi:hypothetical protein
MNNYVSEIFIEDNKVNIHDLEIDINDIHVVTSMKVGTFNFIESLVQHICNIEKKSSYDFDISNHTHNLEYFKEILEKDRNKLIITCFRNPINRNISFYFDTFINKNFSDMYLCDENDLYKYSYQDITNDFNKKKYLINEHYNSWYDEFFRISNIKYDYLKKNGVQLFKINKNSYILLCKLEKYENNIPLLENFLTFKLKNNQNNVNEKQHIKEYTKKIYNNFKKCIKIDNDYKDELLNNDLIKFLYDEEEIKSMYNLY